MSAKPTTSPPAYFLSLSLENVRSFGEKQTISFAREDGRPAQWTIILGDNGVGKTTVLRSLAAIGIDFDKDVFPDDEFKDSKFDYDWQIKWWPTRNDELTTLINYKAHVGDLYFANATEHNSESAIQILGKHEEAQNKYHLRIESIPRNLWGLLCYGYGAGRTTGNSTLSERPNSTNNCASLFNDRADLLNPEEWFLFADYTMAKDKDPLTIQNFNLLKTALLEVMAEGEVTDMEVSPVSLGGGSPRQGVRFKTPYGWVRLKDMSLGYQTLVVWLTDFASKLFIRYPESKNPLKEPAIVLIDEIDLHLHPSWQRKLISSLSKIFTKTQFIATAHSPLVVQAATDADANVVLLKREGDQTKVYQGYDLPDVRRWRIEQILSSELFDDTPVLSAQTETDLERRNQLRLKKRLTAKEKEELARLEAALTSQPVGATAPERRAEDLLAQLARNLGQSEMLQ